MSSKAFSKGIVEIINSSKNKDRVENEILHVFDTLSSHKEALDVFFLLQSREFMIMFWGNVSSVN